MGVGALLLWVFIAATGPMLYGLPTTVASSQGNDDGDDGNFRPPKPTQPADSESSEGTHGSSKKKRKKDVGSGDMSYPCRFCDQVFDKSQALGGHMNRHRQEREQEERNNTVEKMRLLMQQGTLGFHMNAIHGPFWTSAIGHQQMFDRSQNSLDAHGNHPGARFTSPQAPYLPAQSNTSALQNLLQANQPQQPPQHNVSAGQTLPGTNYSNPLNQGVHLQRERPTFQGPHPPQPVRNSGQGQAQTQTGLHADPNPNLMQSPNQYSQFNTGQLHQHPSFFSNQPGPSTQLPGPSTQTIQDCANNQHIRQAYNPLYHAQPCNPRSLHVDASGNLAPSVNMNAHTQPSAYPNPTMAMHDQHQFQSEAGHDQHRFQSETGHDQRGPIGGGGEFDHLHDHGFNTSIDIEDIGDDGHEVDGLNRHLEGSVDTDAILRDARLP